MRGFGRFGFSRILHDCCPAAAVGKRVAKDVAEVPVQPVDQRSASLPDQSLSVPVLMPAVSQDQRVAVESLQIDDSVRVRPGERFPVDGIVTEGETWADESTSLAGCAGSRRQYGSGRTEWTSAVMGKDPGVHCCRGPDTYVRAVPTPA